MARLATFDLFRFGPGATSIARVLARIPGDRLGLRRSRIDGLVLGRLMGTARGDSTARGADLGRWAVFAVWEDPDALERFEAAHDLAARWREDAIERWSARLVPRRSRGRWSGVDPFPTGPPGTNPAGKTAAGQNAVAVLTRAAVRPSRLRRFAAAQSPVDDELHRAPGLVAAIGMGEWPMGRQATFSLWRDEAAVRRFATGTLHADVVRRTRGEGWYAEELFTAFTVVAHRGRWDGADPLGLTPGPTAAT